MKAHMYTHKQAHMHTHMHTLVALVERISLRWACESVINRLCYTFMLVNFVKRDIILKEI